MQFFPHPCIFCTLVLCPTLFFQGFLIGHHRAYNQDGRTRWCCAQKHFGTSWVFSWFIGGGYTHQRWMRPQRDWRAERRERPDGAYVSRAVPRDRGHRDLPPGLERHLLRDGRLPPGLERRYGYSQRPWGRYDRDDRGDWNGGRFEIGIDIVSPLGVRRRERDDDEAFGRWRWRRHDDEGNDD